MDGHVNRLAATSAGSVSRDVYAVRNLGGRDAFSVEEVESREGLGSLRCFPSRKRILVDFRAFRSLFLSSGEQFKVF